MMPFMGRLLERYGARPLVCCGGAILVAYCFLSMGWIIDSSPLFLGMTMVVRGLGISFLLTPLSILSVNSVATEQAGTASALSNLTQQLFGALGVALYSCGYELLHVGESSGGALGQSFHMTMALAGVANLSIFWFAFKLPARDSAVDEEVPVEAA